MQNFKQGDDGVLNVKVHPVNGMGTVSFTVDRLQRCPSFVMKTPYRVVVELSQIACMKSRLQCGASPIL